MGLELTNGQVAALEKRTEGWIAGLQLAALSMQGREDLGRFVSAFTGSNHYIMDYLVEEVLARQPDDVRDFLLRTAVLDRLSGPLCDALTGFTGSPEGIGGQMVLEHLLRSNLFLEPLDDDRHWFRYHQLFADVLSNRLRRERPELIPDLHRSASQWYEQVGLVGDAVRHALATQDYERVVRVIKQHGVRMAREYDISEMRMWMDALPASVWEQDAELNLVRIYASWTLLRMDDVELCMDRIERILQRQQRSDPSSMDTPEQQLMAAYYLGIRSRLAALRDDCDGAIRLAAQALDVAPADANHLRSIVYPGLYTTYRAMGDIEKAIPYCEQAIHFARLADHRVLVVDSMANLSEMHLVQGRLYRALEVADEGLKYTEAINPRDVPACGVIYAAKALALCKRSDLDAAESMSQRAVSLGRQSGRPGSQFHSYLVVAEVQSTRGDLAAALKSLESAAGVLPAPGLERDPKARDQIEGLRARIHLRLGDPTRAIELVDTFEPRVGNQATLREREAALAYAQLCALLDRRDEAQRVLQALVPLFQSAGHLGWLVEALALQAQVLNRRSTAGAALASLQRALDLAEPEEYLSPFLGGGTSLAELLRLAQLRGIAPGFTSRILAALPADQGQASTSSPHKELLSGRELELLRLVAAGRSNKEIAGELVIAIGTVKRHAANIFNKLDVRNRTEAVARARELGLL